MLLFSTSVVEYISFMLCHCSSASILFAAASQKGCSGVLKSQPAEEGLYSLYLTESGGLMIFNYV